MSIGPSPTTTTSSTPTPPTSWPFLLTVPMPAPASMRTVRSSGTTTVRLPNETLATIGSVKSAGSTSRRSRVPVPAPSRNGPVSPMLASGRHVTSPIRPDGTKLWPTGTATIVRNSAQTARKPGNPEVRPTRPSTRITRPSAASAPVRPTTTGLTDQSYSAAAQASPPPTASARPVPSSVPAMPAERRVGRRGAFGGLGAFGRGAGAGESPVKPC